MNTMPVSITKSNLEPPMDLWDYSKIASHGLWEPVPHINLIIELLHYCLNGQIENLDIALAPRLGKSMEISEIFPSYVLGTRPYAKIILVSYSDSLARGFGSKAKDNLEEFGYLFQDRPRLSQDTKAKNYFKIRNNTGEFFCSGSSGSVLGHGGHFIIIDDPTKNIEEARSERHQEKLIDLFDTTISTRKEKDPYTGQNAVTIVIHQRLDQNDLTGIILQNREWITAEEALPRLRNGEKLGHLWVYLRLPELAEENDILGRKPGQALWPEKRNEKELQQIRKDIGEYKFNAIHQQDPKPREGKFFQENYFEVIDLLPNDIIQEVQWADLAATKYPENTPISLRGPSTALVRLALTKDRKMIITAIDEFWEEDDVVMKNIINSAKLGGKQVKYCIPQDPGQAGKGQVKKYSIQMPGYNFNGIIESGSKEDRAEAPGNWSKVNKFYIYNKAPGMHMLKEHGSNEEAITRFINTCTQFPGGRHKDFVDSLSGAFSEIEIPEEEEEKSMDLKVIQL